MELGSLMFAVQLLYMLVLTAGIVFGIVGVRRLGSLAILCGLGSATLLATRLAWLLSALGYPSSPPQTLLAKLYFLSINVLPFAESLGAALLIFACLHRAKRPLESKSRTRHDWATTSLLRRTVALPVWILSGAMALVVAAGALITALVPTDDAVPRLVRGTVTQVYQGGASFAFTPDRPGRHRIIQTLDTRTWIDKRGAQHNDARPICLHEGVTTHRRVELAFLDVKGGRRYGFGDRSFLLSIRCLD